MECNMERRKDKRIKQSMAIRVNNKPGKVVDISRNGLRLSTSLTRTSRNIDIALKAENRMFNLEGIIQWMRNKRDPYRNMTELGVCVPNPPMEYRQFLDTLNWDAREHFEYGWVLIILSIMLFVGVLFGILTLLDIYHF
jgi:hypothetical protein